MASLTPPPGYALLMLWMTRYSVLAIAAAIALAGCSSPSPESNPTTAAAPSASAPSAAPSEPGVEPASGTTIKGNGYSFTAPKGWEVPDDEKPAGVDTVVADLNDTDGFSDNMNVLLSPAGEVTPDQVESQGPAELEGAGATKVIKRDRLTIAGSESAHLSAVFSAQGKTYQVEQFYATHSGQTYIASFSFSPSVSEADRNSLAASVLQTWDWAA